MKKIYVIDSNVVLTDAHAIAKFGDNKVIIPSPVIEEVDNHKKDVNEVGRNARQFSRNLDALRKQGGLVDGVLVNEEGGTLQVILYEEVALDLSHTDMKKIDNQILATALWVKKYATDEEVIFLTNDTNLRIKGDIHGLNAQAYEINKVDEDELYDGCEIVDVAEDIINTIYDKGKIDIVDIPQSENFYPNMCILLRNMYNEKHCAPCIYNDVMKELVLIEDNLTTMEITPRNLEQRFALTLLLDQNIKLVTMSGKAGSGKGLMSAAAALKQIFEDKIYEKIVIARPIVALNNSHQLGFMPGDQDEKLSPWLKPFKENFEFILSGYKKKGKIVKPPKTRRKKDQQAYNDELEKEQGILDSAFDELKTWDLLELASLETIKGRTFMNQMVIITEAQDCSLEDIKAIVTRIGEGSKLVLEGDIMQTDNPRLDTVNNGLSIVAERFKPYNIAGHIALKKSERSELAELAANIL